MGVFDGLKVLEESFENIVFVGFIGMHGSNLTRNWQTQHTPQKLTEGIACKYLRVLRAQCLVSFKMSTWNVKVLQFQYLTKKSYSCFWPTHLIQGCYGKSIHSTIAGVAKDSYCWISWLTVCLEGWDCPSFMDSYPDFCCQECFSVGKEQETGWKLQKQALQDC